MPGNFTAERAVPEKLQARFPVNNSESAGRVCSRVSTTQLSAAPAIGTKNPKAGQARLPGAVPSIAFLQIRRFSEERKNKMENLRRPARSEDGVVKPSNRRLSGAEDLA